MPLIRDAIRNVLQPIRFDQSVAGVTVRYHAFVSGDVFSLCVTMTSSTTDSQTSEGIVFTEVLKDFQCKASDFVRYAIVPQRRDRIEWRDSDTGITRWFELLELGGQKAVEPLGNYGDYYTLHTKEIPAE